MFRALPASRFAPVLSNRSMPASGVIPVLTYSNVRATASWLREAFGFEERLVIGTHRVRLHTRGDDNFAGSIRRSGAEC
jgi:hypothetical protein